MNPIFFSHFTFFVDHLSLLHFQLSLENHTTNLYLKKGKISFETQKNFVFLPQIPLGNLFSRKHVQSNASKPSPSINQSIRTQ